MFVALEPRRLYQRVADQIRRLIESGELKPGDRLPAERDLAERFGISRPTIREALIVLEVEGYLQIRIGTGVYVNPTLGISSAPLSGEENDSPFEILQARCLIESAIAEEAARCVTPKSLARLDAILNRMASALDAAAAFTCDRAFHTAIADTINNGALNRFIGLIYDKRASPYFKKLASYFEGPHSWKLALEEHWLIRDGIAAKNPAAAREAMRRHLTLAQKRFSESFGGESDEE